MIVTMHFGDGTHKEIEVESDNPEEAVKEAKEWVQDNAWFEATDSDTDKVLAEVHLYG